MSLVEGAPLMIEDLNVTMNVVTFTDPLARIYYKYRGKVSKRRFNNIMKMAHKRNPIILWKDLLNESK